MLYNSLFKKSILKYQEDSKLYPKPTIPITMTDSQPLDLASICPSCERVDPCSFQLQ